MTSSEVLTNIYTTSVVRYYGTLFQVQFYPFRCHLLKALKFNDLSVLLISKNLKDIITEIPKVRFFSV